MKRLFLYSLLLVSTLLGTVLAYDVWRTQKLEGPDAPSPTTWQEIDPTQTDATAPQKLSIALPFYSQAPFGNWDYPWQEACEEASIALVANLYLEKNWSKEAFNEELLRLVDWEMDRFGAYEHTTVAQTVQMIEENYGLKTVVHENPTFEDLQSSIASGHLIVAPFAGKQLNNPNFTNGGPVYHMLVIKGYDATKNQVVTHDVGTRNGEDYVYTWSVIQSALHDWHNTDIEQGAARWIEVLPL
ncbi:C39 family peptidase [Candidatus Peregrinibacteria bacterium]|nr:MAG: C39 family peptidase [Candidatus Peregrinibacteria bacterium]